MSNSPIFQYYTPSTKTNVLWRREFCLEINKHKNFSDFREVYCPEFLKNKIIKGKGAVAYKEQFILIIDMLPYNEFFETLHNEANKLLRKDKLKAIEQW